MITLEDIKTLCEVEFLLHKELTNDKNINKESKEWETWNKYWNFVEKVCVWKDSFVKEIREFDKERGE